MSHRYNLRHRQNTDSESEDRHHQKRNMAHSTTDSEDSDESPVQRTASPKPHWKGSMSDLGADSVDSFQSELASPPSTAGSSAAPTPSPRLARQIQQYRFSPESLHSQSFQSSLSTAGSPAALTPSPRLARRIQQDRSSSPESTQSWSFQSSPNTYPERSKKKDRDVKDEKKSLQLLIIGCVLLCLVLVLFFYKSYLTDEKPHAEMLSKFQEFKNQVNELKTLFPSQDERTWKTLKASVRHVLDGNDPQYPAVILFAVPESASKLGTCFAQQVAQRFKNSTGLKEYIDCRQSSNLSPSAAKLDLDEQIHTHFQTGKAVVIDHLESLSPESVLLLHGTCDNDNAPFKDVLISLVFHLDIPRDINHKQVESKVEEYLKSGLDEDKVGAMLSRIANNIVVVRHEKKELIDKVVLDCII